MHISKELLLGDLLIADEVLIVSKKESFCTLITILACFSQYWVICCWCI